MYPPNGKYNNLFKYFFSSYLQQCIKFNLVFCEKHPVHKGNKDKNKVFTHHCWICTAVLGNEKFYVSITLTYKLKCNIHHICNLYLGTGLFHPMIECKLIHKIDEMTAKKVARLNPPHHPPPSIIATGLETDVARCGITMRKGNTSKKQYVLDLCSGLQYDEIRYDVCHDCDESCTCPNYLP